MVPDDIFICSDAYWMIFNWPRGQVDARGGLPMLIFIGSNAHWDILGAPLVPTPLL